MRKPSMVCLTGVALAFLLSGVALVLLEFSTTGKADPITLHDLALDVDCNANKCPIRVVVVRAGSRIVSGPLPFDAIGPEIVPAALQESFGYRLPGQDPRELAIWMVGPDEEKAVGVAIEVAETDVAGSVLIVHQTVGFDHVKRAHVILAPHAGKLREIKRLVENAGPEIIVLAPVEGGWSSADRS